MSKRCEFDKLWASGETERIQEFQSCGGIESNRRLEVVHELLCVILSIYEDDWRHP